MIITDNLHYFYKNNKNHHIKTKLLKEGWSMSKRILSMLLVVTICMELLAGCGTMAVAAVPGTKELQQDITVFTGEETKGFQPQFVARPAYWYIASESLHSGSYNIYGCVQSSKPTSIVGKLIDKLPYESLQGKIKPKLSGAMVTLVDKTGRPCLDVNGEKQKASTDEHGYFILTVDANALTVKVRKGKEAYQNTHYIKIEKEGYRPIIEQVGVISRKDFEKETERYLLEEKLPQVQEILDNTQDGVGALYLEGEEQASDKMAYRKEYPLAALEAGREEIRTGAEQLLALQTEEGRKVFWDKAEDLAFRSWGEWFQEMYDGLPERWKLYILSARVHMLDVNTFNSYVPGAAESQVAARAEIAKKIEELNATTPIWKDDEFWNLNADIVKEIGIWIALDYATAGLGHWARMYGFFNKGVKAYALTGEAARAGAALKQMKGGTLYLTEEQATVANRVITSLTRTDEGKVIWEQVEKGLAMRRNVHPAELQQLLLKAVDDKIAAETEKANAIRAAAQTVKETRIAELEEKLTQTGKNIKELEQAQQDLANTYLYDSKKVPRDVMELICQFESSSLVSMEEIRSKGAAYYKLWIANHENGHALAMALNNYEALTMKGITIASKEEEKWGQVLADIKEGVLTSGENLALGMDSLGSIVAERRLYGRIAEGSGIISESRGDWIEMWIDFNKAVSQTLEEKGIVLTLEERRQVLQTLIAEYYHRIDVAFAEIEKRGVLEALANELVKRETIDGQTYRTLIESLMEKHGLKGLSGEQWMISESLEEGIRINADLGKQIQEYGVLQRRIAEIQKEGGLIPEELTTLINIEARVAGFKSARNQIAAWDTSLFRGMQVVCWIL